MCGIVGVASRDPVADQDWLVAGRDALAHRGPDDAGLWWSADGRIGLGQRRLAIIDLSPGGHQPMVGADGEIAVNFNGEIYNFMDLRAELKAIGIDFRSRSDTEVILEAYRAWGIECLNRLNGMFALAIYDARRRVLFLARDRAGEKPLYYQASNGMLRFASELKAFLTDPRVPRQVDHEALDCYLSMGFVPGSRCILRGFNKLPPAHVLRYDLANGEFDVRRYWELPDAPSVGAVDEEVLVRELEALLQDSVRRQLLAADVPVGILLSGGVDSSIVTSLAVRARERVKTFTIRFPGHGKLDETEHARLIARHFGTEHVELTAEATTVDLLPMLARQYDEPLIDSSMIPTYLVSKLVRQHCTVALGGDGGDELFGGYNHYDKLLRLEKLLRPVPQSLCSGIAFAAEHLLPSGTTGRNWLIACGTDLRKGAPQVALYFDAGTRRKLMSHTEVRKQVAEEVYRRSVSRADHLLDRATRTDFNSFLPEDILVKVDRASMRNSLEVRAPMLDHRVIEFAYGKVPACLKATAQEKKILLKRLAVKVLPREFDRRRKQGFSIPLANWLRSGTFRDLFYDVLLDGRCTFDRAAVTGLLHGLDSGRNNGERLFGLVMFELWRREYAVTV